MEVGRRAATLPTSSISLTRGKAGCRSDSRSLRVRLSANDGLRMRYHPCDAGGLRHPRSCRTSAMSGTSCQRYRLRSSGVRMSSLRPDDIPENSTSMPAIPAVRGCGPARIRQADRYRFQARSPRAGRNRRRRAVVCRVAGKGREHGFVRPELHSHRPASSTSSAVARSSSATA